MKRIKSVGLNEDNSLNLNDNNSENKNEKKSEKNSENNSQTISISTITTNVLCIGTSPSVLTATLYVATGNHRPVLLPSSFHENENDLDDKNENEKNSDKNLYKNFEKIAGSGTDGRTFTDNCLKQLRRVGVQIVSDLSFGSEKDESEKTENNLKNIIEEKTEKNNYNYNNYNHSNIIDENNNYYENYGDLKTNLSFTISFDGTTFHTQLKKENSSVRIESAAVVTDYETYRNLIAKELGLKEKSENKNLKDKNLEENSNKDSNNNLEESLDKKLTEDLNNNSLNKSSNNSSTANRVTDIRKSLPLFVCDENTKDENTTEAILSIGNGCRVGMEVNWYIGSRESL